MGLNDYLRFPIDTRGELWQISRVSEKYDAMKQVRLTPNSLKLLDELAKDLAVPVSINALANAAIEEGVPILAKQMEPIRKSKKK